MRFQTDYPAHARLRTTASESGSQIIDRPPKSLGNAVDVFVGMMSKAFCFLVYSCQPPESLHLTVVILISYFPATRAGAGAGVGSLGGPGQRTLDRIRGLWRKLSWAVPCDVRDRLSVAGANSGEYALALGAGNGALEVHVVGVIPVGAAHR